MTTNLESLKNAPTSAPSKAPSEDLLKNFRATLESGWEKFDSAVPSVGKSGPFASDDYSKVKEEYDSAKKMLADIKNDDELRANIPMRQKLDETIKMLGEHNAKSNKEKSYNKALVEMEANLAKLQKDVEKNNTVLPVSAIAVAAGGAIATEAVDGLSTAVKKGTNNLKTEIAGIKNNPMKKIAEFFGFNESSIVSDIKGALNEKKEGGLGGFFAEIKIWFGETMAKVMGVDLSKLLTPEEMKLAGIKGGKGKEEEKPKTEKPEEEKKGQEKLVKDLAYTKITSHLINRDNQLVLKGFFDSLGKGIWIKTWGEDEQKAKDDMVDQAKITLGLDSIAPKTFAQLKSDFSGTYNVQEKAMKYKISGQKEIDGLQLAMKSLIDNEKWIESNLKSSNPDWRNKPIYDSLNSLYHGIGYSRIENMQKTFSNIDWSSPNDFGDKLKSMMITSKDGKLSGLLGDRMESMKSQGFSLELATRIFENDAEGNQPISSYRKTLAGHKFEGNTQDLLQKIVEPNGFAKNMNALFSKFDLGNYASNFHGGEGLSIRQVTSLYLITGGITDPEKMSPGMRSELYTMLLSIVAKDSPGALSGEMLMKFFDTPTSPYVSEFVEFIGAQMNKATYMATLGAMGFAKGTIDLLGKIKDTNPTMFYTVIAATIGAALLAIYMRKPIAIGVLTATILGIAAKIGVVSAVS